MSKRGMHNRRHGCIVVGWRLLGCEVLEIWQIVLMLMVVRDEELVILEYVSRSHYVQGQSSNQMRHHSRSATLIQCDEKEWSRSSVYRSSREVAFPPHELHDVNRVHLLTSGAILPTPELALASLLHSGSSQ